MSVWLWKETEVVVAPVGRVGSVSGAQWRFLFASSLDLHLLLHGVSRVSPIYDGIHGRPFFKVIIFSWSGRHTFLHFSLSYSFCVLRDIGGLIKILSLYPLISLQDFFEVLSLSLYLYLYLYFSLGGGVFVQKSHAFASSLDLRLLGTISIYKSNTWN